MFESETRLKTSPYACALAKLLVRACYVVCTQIALNLIVAINPAQIPLKSMLVYTRNVGDLQIGV